MIILGLMSGSSLDGMDIAICSFANSSGLSWKILETHSVDFTTSWKEKLKKSVKSNLTEFYSLNVKYSEYLGSVIAQIANRTQLDIDYVAIHGHTLHHAPRDKYTIQMGSGSHLTEYIDIPVIDQFRIQDIIAGGQGAPLAHIADIDLFPGFSYYLNLGGIANLSILGNRPWSSFDVCGANQILDRLASEKGKNFDENGEMASQGKVHHTLLNNLMEHPYITGDPPKSLDNQYTLQEFYEPFRRISLSTEDKLATAVEFIARSIESSLPKDKRSGEQIFITGGGAWNQYLIERIQQCIDPVEIVIPEAEVINYKEALLIAYCGALRVWGQSNCRGEITGAYRDTVNGAIHHPQSFFH